MLSSCVCVAPCRDCSRLWKAVIKTRWFRRLCCCSLGLGQEKCFVQVFGSFQLYFNVLKDNFTEMPPVSRHQHDTRLCLELLIISGNFMSWLSLWKKLYWHKSSKFFSNFEANLPVQWDNMKCPDWLIDWFIDDRFHCSHGIPGIHFCIYQRQRIWSFILQIQKSTWQKY